MIFARFFVVEGRLGMDSSQWCFVSVLSSLIYFTYSFSKG